MSLYVRLDVRFFAHPKVVKAGTKAAFLFVAGLLWSQEELTDGTVPKGAVKQLAAKVDVPATVARALVREGLWHDAGDHYLINDWNDEHRMRSREQINGKRKATAVRTAAWRARNAATNGHGDADCDVSSDAWCDAVTDAPGDVHISDLRSQLTEQTENEQRASARNEDR